MRVLLGLCLVLVLGGCNLVVSDHPLFFASTGPDAPKLKNGLWVIDDPDRADCHFDARKPVTRWPDCAVWFLVRDGEFLNYDKPRKGDRAGVGEWVSMPIVLSAGEPIVLQFEGSTDEKPSFQFFGVEGIPSGSAPLTAFNIWPVVCGPPPPDGAMLDGQRRYVTQEPFPGLTVTDDGCTATEASAVRNAAILSRSQIVERPGGAHWVRDSYP